MTTATQTAITNILTDACSGKHGITDDHWRTAFEAVGGVAEIGRGGDAWAEVSVGDRFMDFQFTGALDDEETFFVRGWVYPVNVRNGMHETDTQNTLSCAYFSIDHHTPGYADIVRAILGGEG